MDALKNLINKESSKWKEVRKSVDPKAKYVARGKIEDRLVEGGSEDKVSRLPVKKSLSKPSVELKKVPDVEKEEKLEDDPLFALSPEEMTSRLRGHGAVVCYFGEDHVDRARRLKKLIVEEGEDMRGQRNIFQSKMAQFEQGEKEEDHRGGSHGEPSMKKRRVQKELSPEEVEKRKAKKKEWHASKEYLIYKLFRGLMAEMVDTLKRKDSKERSGLAAKRYAATVLKSSEEIKPLFELCKTRRLPEKILVPLHKLAVHVTRGEYRKAGNVYLQELGVGSGAYPIGLTMVGIHERSAREKIFSQTVQHIMNDEQQMNYLHAVKRLMTFVQDQKGIAPSKKI